ncbi:18030_t:CDS:2 [Dentiscutata erythropus]|uniref:18030_t:CDS:1 n=1 Tax=Dentiscutata erythropus TaxID=1348616 RepID=A0A9N9IB49_9GLOM|nr:18030_t:CDS:2 [Dentiscutata erythropus]
MLINDSDSNHLSSYNVTITWSNKDEFELDTPEKSWVWFYFRRSQPDKKIYCQVKVTNDDSNEESCNHDYELTTGTGNLKAHLHQIHKILPPENNNSNSLTKIVSNQSSLDDFMNKKTSLPFLKQEKNCKSYFSLDCYMAHMIQLALGDRFNITEINSLISKAKELNSYVNGKDKYHEQLRILQATLNPQHLISSLLSNTRTC